MIIDGMCLFDFVIEFAMHLGFVASPMPARKVGKLKLKVPGRFSPTDLELTVRFCFHPSAYHASVRITLR